MSDIDKIKETLLRFRDERDWKQFHNAKDLAIAINVEAAELLELFLWKDAAEVSVDKISEELADIFSYAFLLAHDQGINIKATILDKIEKNASRYPVDKAKGNAKKYDKL